MGKVSIKGVLIGSIVDVAASVVLGLPFAIYAVANIDLSNTARAGASAGVTAAIHTNVPMYVALGIYTMASGKDSNALWVQILLLLASPALALIGGDLVRRRRQARIQPA
jgi:hypothetical protein